MAILEILVGFGLMFLIGLVVVFFDD